MRRGLLLGVLLLAALSCLACAPTKKPLFVQHDPSFTPQRLRQDRIAVMPARATTPLLDDAALNYLRNRLSSALSHRYAEAVVPIHDVDAELSAMEQSAMAPASMKQTSIEPASIQDRSRAQGQSRAQAQSSLQRVAEALGVRYLVFPSFDRYSFGWAKDEQIIYHEPADGSCDGITQLGDVPSCLLIAAIVNAAGRAEPSGEVKTNLSAIAMLAGSVMVFDAHQGKPVWLGATVTRKEAQRTTVRRLDGGAKRAREDYPQVPPLRIVANSFLAELVTRWP